MKAIALLETVVTVPQQTLFVSASATVVIKCKYLIITTLAAQPSLCGYLVTHKSVALLVNII